jgi:predicted helicase
LEQKITFFFNEYNSELERWNEYKKLKHYQDIKKESNPILDDFLEERNVIKWSNRIKRDKFRKDKKAEFSITDIRQSFYRPFVSMYLYFGYIPIDLRGQMDDIFPRADKKNKAIVFNCNCSTFSIVATDILIEYGSLLVGGGRTQCLPLYRYDSEGTRTDNI